MGLTQESKCVDIPGQDGSEDDGGEGMSAADLKCCRSVAASLRRERKHKLSFAISLAGTRGATQTPAMMARTIYVAVPRLAEPAIIGSLGCAGSIVGKHGMLSVLIQRGLADPPRCIALHLCARQQIPVSWIKSPASA